MALLSFKKNKQSFFIVQCKIKSFSPIYILKVILNFKKSINFVTTNIFLPPRNKEIVVLRSPFVYKSSRLKYKFTTSSALLNCSFFVSGSFTLNFLIEEHILQLVASIYAGNSIYSCKKKYQNYYF